MTEAEFHQLCETAWRRELTPVEQSQVQAWLADHPEARADWEADLALNGAINRLPDVPVSSNFTARVLAAVEHEQRKAERESTPSWLRAFTWLPRFAGVTAVVAVTAAGLYWHEHRQGGHQPTAPGPNVELATMVTRAAEVIAVPATDKMTGPEILRDFEAINQLGKAPAFADVDLLSALR